MPKYVLNKEIRQLHDVPEEHWSLGSPDYLVFDKKPTKSQLEKAITSLIPARRPSSARTAVGLSAKELEGGDEHVSEEGDENNKE